MGTRYRRALHVFRRDLRLPDNTALRLALQESETVATCFVLDDRQVGAHAYRSTNGLAFMVESLESLALALERQGGRLIICRGEPAAVVANLIAALRVEAVFVNRDYTPFSQTRDEAIEEVCIEAGVAFRTCHDALLVAPDALHKDNGEPYTVFTPFFKKASLLAVPKPALDLPGRFSRADDYRGPSVSPRDVWPAVTAPERVDHGGREQALNILGAIGTHAAYEIDRDRLDHAGTTHLSAHHKFGTVSILESYHTVAGVFDAQHPLIRQFYWRDFFTHITWHFPYVFGHAFQRKYDGLVWRGREEWFQAWCEGRTGFPIVDAGMRELAATGSMHNRARMIVASFLVKDLHIDWRRGEQWFARHLTDYDPAVNNGNWQWAASTGCDAQPYFRIFNPWLQQKRFDPDCRYIRRWVPELAEMPPAQIHAWHTASVFDTPDYPRPIVDHDTQKAEALAMFQRGPRVDGGAG